MRIVGSILEQNEETFITSFDRLSPITPEIQIDIADGHYVKNTTLPLREIIALLQKKEIKNKLEFHLMTNTPDEDITLLKSSDLPVSLVYVPTDFLNRHTVSSRIPIGAVLNPEHTIKEMYKHISSFPYIQIMTVHPGWQGSPFLPETIRKIKELRDVGYNGEITLDGGINPHTLELILKESKKPDRLVVGSFLLQGNTKKNYDSLLQRGSHKR